MICHSDFRKIIGQNRKITDIRGASKPNFLIKQTVGKVIITTTSLYSLTIISKYAKFGLVSRARF